MRSKVAKNSPPNFRRRNSPPNFRGGETDPAVLRSVWSAAARLRGDALSFGQEFPERPVRCVVGFTPGGPSDIIARALGQKLSERWAQQVVIENRPGAGGNIAAEIAAKSPPDGYTWLLGNNSILATNQSLYRTLAFDPVRDFAPVALVAIQPNILVVQPAVPASSVKELIALAKAKPGQLNYASSGAARPRTSPPSCSRPWRASTWSTCRTRAPSPRSPTSSPGRRSSMFATSASVIPYIKAGRLRALAVTTAQRSPSVPELPTVSEAGAESD